MPINSEHLASLTDATVIDQNGDKVGGVGQIYLDDASGQPAWVSVKSGLFGLRESFVPLGAAEVVNGNIQVPYAKDMIKDSPRVDADNHLDDSQQALLYDYYGVERGAAATTGDTSDGADRTATYGSEQVAEELHDARSDGEDEREADEEAEKAQGLSEYADARPTADPAPQAGGPAAPVSPGGPAAPASPGGPVSADAAAIGAAAAVAARGPAAQERGADAAEPDEGPITAEEAAAAGGNAEWAETRQAHYQQANPAAQEDWAAEESPEEPVSTDWSVPSTDPADEEPTRVSRSGYSPDRPAAHSSAYEGHSGPPAPAAPAPTEVAAAAATGAAAAAASDAGSEAGNDVDGTRDMAQFGTVEPVTAETTVPAETALPTHTPEDVTAETVTDDLVTDDVAAGDPATDDAVTGAEHQTGTGYPSTGEEPGGLGGADAAVAAAAAAGTAAGGIAASDTGTTAYEVPGAELGKPVADTEPGTELAVDTEDPADALTAPAEDATLDAGTDAGVDDTGEPETYGAQGYHPDRDGTGMTDEERERLNQARGAL